MTLLVTQCRVGEVRTQQGGERVVCGGVEDCSKRERVGERCNDMVSWKKASTPSINSNVQRLRRYFPIKRDKARTEDKAAGIWTAGYGNSSDLPPAPYPHRIGFYWQARAYQHDTVTKPCQHKLIKFALPCAWSRNRRIFGAQDSLN